MELLRNNPATSGLLPSAERLLRLEQDLHQCLQELAQPVPQQTVDIITGADDVITLGIDSPAVAGRLRQILPSLQARLAARGWKVSSIRLRVQPGKPRTNSEANAKRSTTRQANLSASALAHWSSLAGTLEHPQLREAVSTLIKHHGSGAARNTMTEDFNKSRPRRKI